MDGLWRSHRVTQPSQHRVLMESFFEVTFSLRFLSEPHFLHAIEYGNYVYFFFREIAVEHNNLGKVGIVRAACQVVVSRSGRRSS